jgi:hypothetical protein
LSHFCECGFNGANAAKTREKRAIVALAAGEISKPYQRRESAASRRVACSALQKNFNRNAALALRTKDRENGATFLTLAHTLLYYQSPTGKRESPGGQRVFHNATLDPVRATYFSEKGTSHEEDRSHRPSFQG